MSCNWLLQSNEIVNRPLCLRDDFLVGVEAGNYISIEVWRHKGCLVCLGQLNCVVPDHTVGVVEEYQDKTGCHFLVETNFQAKN